MAIFENIVLAVYYQVMTLLIEPMSLETNLFIADEDDWYDVKPLRCLKKSL